MRAQVVLVSSNHTVRDVFLRKKDAVIPKSLRDHSRIKSLGMSFNTSFYDPKSAGRPLESYVLHAARNAEMVALLVDNVLSELALPLTPACLVGRVTYDPDASSYENIIAGQLTRLIKNLASVADMMTSAGNQLPLLLPWRNFIAPEWTQLQEVFRRDGSDSSLPLTVGNFVKELNQRKRPRKRSTSQQTYLVDDDSKLFDYGKERHAKLATGAPHSAMCELTGNFRFGKRIPSDRHYNVTKEVGALTKIGGCFLNCHDAESHVQETTHLNMFSNDYHA